MAGSTPVAGRLGRCQATTTMDEWIERTYQAMIEAWQQEAVPGLLRGRAITLTIHAAPNQPARLDVAQHFRDPGWPAPQTTRGSAPNTQRRQ